ncbi:MAG: hypothetical protein QXU32_06670 [Nitrososphaerales archaeon]
MANGNGNWFFRLEVDDENNLPLTIDNSNRGFRLILRERNEHSLEFAVRDIGMDHRIVRGHRCRVFGEYNNPSPTIKIFEGIMTDKNEKGTWNKRLEIFARDLFRDRLLTKTVNEKYQQLKAGQIFRDIVQRFLGPEFTVNGVQDTSVTISEDFPFFMAELTCDTLAEDTLAEYFCKANLDCVFRPIRTDDSGLTITESMVRDMTEVKRSLAESISEAIVVGGLDENQQRIIARSVDDTLPEEIRGRKRAIHDKRFTTYQRAKLKALSILSELGKDFVNVPPIEVRDLSSLPRPGQLIALNMPMHGLNSVKLVVKQIQVDLGAGYDGVQWIKFWLGESEKTVEEKILVQQALFERERARGTLFEDISTQQLLNAKDLVVVGEGQSRIKRCANFYLDSVPAEDPDGCIFSLDGKHGGSELDV